MYIVKQTPSHLLLLHGGYPSMRAANPSCGRTLLILATLAVALSSSRIARLYAQDPVLPPGVLSILKGHTADVYSIAFSPDGKHVLTGSFDKSIKLWDATTGKEIKTYEGPNAHQQIVLTVAFSPDGRSFASGASDNQVKIWDATIGPPLRNFLHAGSVLALAVSPDGTKAAGAGQDGIVGVWNVADGKPLFSLKGHVGPVTGITYSGNGSLLASRGSDRTLRVWNPANGQALASIGAHPTSVTGMVAALGGNMIYTAGEDGVLKFWQIPVKPPRMLAAHTGPMTAMSLSADSQLLVTGSADKTVRITDFGNGQAGPVLAGAWARLSPWPSPATRIRLPAHCRWKALAVEPR